MKLTFTVVFLTLILQVCSKKNKSGKYFPKETPICKIKEHPYVVGIIRSATFEFLCAGSLLSANYVLTATEYLDQERCNMGSYLVMAGANFLHKNSSLNPYAQFSEVVECILYSKEPNRSKNIAVLKLKTAIDENFDIKFVVLGSVLTVSKAGLENVCYNGTVMGWLNPERWYLREYGDFYEEEKHMALLRCDNLPALSWEKCKKFNGSMPMMPDMFCAHRNSTGNCHGNTGGPLMCNGLQFGLLSRGAGCNKTYPALFVKVYEYAHLIERTITGKFKSSGSSLKTCFFLHFVLFVIIFN